jgi:outer membrane scaffolding protein for murein synthesis (MipA/OmpV family)
MMSEYLTNSQQSSSPTLSGSAIAACMPAADAEDCRSSAAPDRRAPTTAARIVGVLMLTMGLYRQAMADQPLAAQSADQTVEVDVTARRQTALDAEAMSISETADAEPWTGKRSIIVGLAPVYGPVYDGAKKSKVSPFPYVDVQGLFGGRVFVSDFRGLGVYFARAGDFKAGASINYQRGRTSSDSDRLRGLPDISGAGVVSGFMTYSLKPFAFEARVQRELGSNPGTEATLGVSFTTALTPRLHVSIGSEVSWTDAKYNEKYFGVTPVEAALATKEGNPMGAYTPGSGVRHITMSGTSVYALTEHWGLVGNIRLSDLIGKAAKDSPLTERAFGASVAFGAIYKF